MKDIAEDEIEKLHRATIACLAGDEQIRNRVILRGGAALRLFYGGLRPIVDFDMVVLRSADESSEMRFIEPDRTVNLLRSRLSKNLHRYYVNFYGQEVWAEENLHFDISVCGERVECSHREIVDGSEETLLVSTAADILASKLTVILENDQSLPPRPQDLFDIVHLIKRSPVKLNASEVIALACVKAANREMPFAVKMFDAEAYQDATREYEDYRMLFSREDLCAQQAWQILTEFLTGS